MQKQFFQRQRPMFQNLEINMVCGILCDIILPIFHIFFGGKVLRFELRASNLLDRLSTTLEPGLQPCDLHLIS
jgi:hypothetical protein